MSTDNGTKINQLLQLEPPGIVLLSSWLAKQGYSHDLQRRYRKGKWLQTIGTGALIRKDDLVDYKGAIYALQKQGALTVHPGGRTAFALLGKAHYLEVSTSKVVLFGGPRERLPAWFKQHPWTAEIDYHATAFLPMHKGLTDIEVNNFSIKVSEAARAMLECLYLAPEKQELMECLELMEGLNNLSPMKVQSLLENCTSVKANRLFLYLAEKAGHQWFKELDVKKIDLGKGKRSIIKNGSYVAKYEITVPKEWEANGKNV